MIYPFWAFFSCNSIPRNGYSALHEVNLSKKNSCSSTLFVPMCICMNPSCIEKFKRKYFLYPLKISLTKKHSIQIQIIFFFSIGYKMKKGFIWTRALNDPSLLVLCSISGIVTGKNLLVVLTISMPCFFCFFFITTLFWESDIAIELTESVTSKFSFYRPLQPSTVGIESNEIAFMTACLVAKEIQGWPQCFLKKKGNDPEYLVPFKTFMMLY